MAGNQHHISEFASLTDEQRGACHCVIVPSSDISFFSVEMPTVARSKWLQLAPWLLEDKLLTSAEDVHFAFGERDVDGLLSVAVVSKKILQRWVDVFDGGEVKYCIPDVFTLAHTPDKWTVSYQADYACVRTGKYSGFAGSVDWVDAILATQAGMELDIHREEVLVSQALEQQDIGQSKSPDLLAGINLLQGSFKPKRNNNSAAIKSWLPLVLAPALVMILFITNMLVESYQFNQTASAYRESSARDFQRLFGTEIDGGSGVLRQEAEYLQRYAQHKDKQLSGGVSGLLQLADKEVSRCVACNLVSLRAQELSLELIFSTVGSDFEAKLSTLPSLIVESKKVGENTVVRIMREAG